MEFEKAREKKTKNYSKLFSNRYDVMRMLIHTLAIFDKIKPNDHKCIGAHLCVKHPKYEFDWETLETMRLLRNELLPNINVGVSFWEEFDQKCQNLQP